jgi:hypothetical protein
MLFGCESSARLGYENICRDTLGLNYRDTQLAALPSTISNSNNAENSETDLINLKNLSLVLDGMLYKPNHLNYSSTWIIPQLFQFLTDSGVNQNIYCAEYKIFDSLAQYNNEAKTQLEQIKTFVINNISTATPMCLETLDKKIYSEEGIYLKTLNTNDSAEFHIYDKCNNIYQLITNE